MRKGSNLPAIAKQRRMNVGGIVGWVLLALAVIALGVAIAERETIMARFPETRLVYGAVGFATPPLGAFRTFQVPIAEITRLTGLDLGPLLDADVLAHRGARSAEWRALSSASDISL